MSNVIDRLDSPPLPFGYQPKWIDFYYFDEADGSRCDAFGASEPAEPQRIEGDRGWFTPSKSTAYAPKLSQGSRSAD
jgi:hypothetical protein